MKLCIQLFVHYINVPTIEILNIQVHLVEIISMIVIAFYINTSCTCILRIATRIIYAV